MKAFTLQEKAKLIIALKKSNIFQLKELKLMIEKEIIKRKKKESKELKKC